MIKTDREEQLKQVKEICGIWENVETEIKQSLEKMSQLYGKLDGDIKSVVWETLMTFLDDLENSTKATREKISIVVKTEINKRDSYITWLFSFSLFPLPFSFFTYPV